MHPAVVYTLGRLILFAAVAIVLWLLGLDPFIVVFGALLISMPLSWFVLRGPRDEWSRRISGGVDRRKQRRADMDRELDEDWERDQSDDGSTPAP